MKQFITFFKAIDNTDGLVKTWVGQTILANSEDEAREVCKEHFPYLSILGEKVSELDEYTLKPINLQNN